MREILDFLQSLPKENWNDWSLENFDEMISLCIEKSFFGRENPLDSMQYRNIVIFTSNDQNIRFGSDADFDISAHCISKFLHAKILLDNFILIGCHKDGVESMPSPLIYDLKYVKAAADEQFENQQKSRSAFSKAECFQIPFDRLKDFLIGLGHYLFNWHTLTVADIPMKRGSHGLANIQLTCIYDGKQDPKIVGNQLPYPIKDEVCLGKLQTQMDEFKWNELLFFRSNSLLKLHWIPGSFDSFNLAEVFQKFSIGKKRLLTFEFVDAPETTPLIKTLMNGYSAFLSKAAGSKTVTHIISRDKDEIFLIELFPSSLNLFII
jgi:hypothetical protein